MRNGDIEHGARPILCHDDDILDISIRNDVHLPYQIPQNSGAQSHTFDDTRKIANLHNVTNAELVFKQDEETGDDILDEALRPETNSQSNDTGAGKHRTDVESEFRADRQYNDRNENSLTDTANNVTQRFRALLDT